MRPAVAASAASPSAVRAKASCGTSAPGVPRSTPSATSFSACATPRRLGSAASVPIMGCAAMIRSVAACTTASSANSSAPRRKNASASGRATSLRPVGRRCSSAARAAAARSAVSGVMPSTTMAITLSRCGNAVSIAFSACRQGRSSGNMRRASVSSAKRVARTQQDATPSRAERTSVSTGRRTLTAASTAAIRPSSPARAPASAPGSGMPVEPIPPSITAARWAGCGSVARASAGLRGKPGSGFGMGLGSSGTQRMPLRRLTILRSAAHPAAVRRSNKWHIPDAGPGHA